MRTTWLRRAVGEEGCTRRQLAHELCVREDWRNGKGGLASARRILPKLARKLKIALPPPQERMPQKAPTRDFLPLRRSLAEVGEVTLEPTSEGQAAVGRRIRAQPPGAQLLDRVVPPWPTGRPSALPAGTRKRATSSSAGRRTHGSPTWMVNRFLLLPGVRVRELASCDLAATRLPGDWEATYGVRPAYTYVSPDQCLLSCGRVGALRQADVRAAAGRRGEGRCKVGEAAGRRLEGTAAPGAGRSVSPTLLSDDWGEYGRGTRGRTRRRMVGRAWEARPGEPVPVPGQGRSGLPAVVEPESVHGPRYPTRNAWSSAAAGNASFWRSRTRRC